MMIEVVFGVFEFIKFSWLGINKIFDCLVDWFIDKKILVFIFFLSIVYELM